MISKQLLSEEEAVNEVREAITSVSGKRWMVAVWCVDQAKQNGRPDVLRLENRTTWLFLHKDFEESFRLLRENLDGEIQVGEPPVSTPLKTASFVLHADDVDVSDEEMGEMGIGPEKEKDEPHLNKLFEPPKGGDAP